MWKVYVNRGLLGDQTYLIIVENLGGPLCCLERARLVFSELPRMVNDLFTGLDRPSCAATLPGPGKYGSLAEGGKC